MNASLEPVDIARAMNDAIKPFGGSDVSDVIYSYMLGVSESIGDYGYLVYDYFDTDQKFQKDNDKFRLINLFCNGLNSDKVGLALEIIYENFFNKLKKEQQELVIRRKFSGIVGGVTANNILFSGTMKSLISNLVGRIVVGMTVTTSLGIGGKMSRAVYSSRRLMMESPGLYWRLRAAGDLDLIYFLIEKQVEPFVYMIKIHEDNPTLFDEVNDKFIMMEP